MRGRVAVLFASIIVSLRCACREALKYPDVEPQKQRGLHGMGGGAADKKQADPRRRQHFDRLIKVRDQLLHVRKEVVKIKGLKGLSDGQMEAIDAVLDGISKRRDMCECCSSQKHCGVTS